MPHNYILPPSCTRKHAHTYGLDAAVILPPWRGFKQEILRVLHRATDFIYCRAWLKSDCATASMVSEWFEDFAATYATTVTDKRGMEGMSQANKEWLTSARARSWHERASETGLYSRTDTVLAPGKCTSEPR